MNAEIAVRITLPMPPSSNSLFTNIRGHGRVRAFNNVEPEKILLVVQCV